VWEQRAIEIHDEESDREDRFHHHRALPASTNFSHTFATRKVSANGDAPTNTEPIGKSCDRIALTVTEFKERSTAWAQEAWQLGDEPTNQLKPVAATIKCETWLCGNAETGQVARCKITNACGRLRAVNLCCWHIRQVCNEKIKVCGITGRSCREKWLGEIAVHEGDA
jgi:hypothetical protein